VNSPSAKAHQSGRLGDAGSLGELAARLPHLCGFATRPAEPLANLPGSGGELPVALDLGLDGAEAGVYALPDHAALEFREGA
jgi:hypothetical protein